MGPSHNPPQSSQPKKFYRWYDQFDNLSAVMNIVENLPLFCQAHLGERLGELVESHLLRMQEDCTYRPRTKIDNILEKSKKRGRWYDLVPSLHRTFTMMATLPPEMLLTINMQLAPLANYLKYEVKVEELPADRFPLIFDTYLFNLHGSR